MKKLLLAAAAAITLVIATTPASAQVRFGADPWGAGVQVGPFGFGVGRDRYWGDRYRHDGFLAPQPHDRSFAKLLFDLGQRQVNRFTAFVGHRSSRWKPAWVEGFKG